MQARWVLMAGMLMACAVPYASLPLLDFYREWVLAAAFSMVCFLVAPPPGKRLGLRFSSLLLAALVLALAVVIQWSFTDQYARTGIFYVFYVSTFLCAWTVGFNGDGLKRVSGAFFVTLVACGLLSCFFAALQLTSSTGEGVFVVTRVSNRVYGNLAQPNIFADMLALALVGMVAMLAEGRVGVKVFFSGVLLFQCFAVFSGSRATWLHALVFGGMGVFLIQGDESGRKKAGVALIFISLMLPLLWFCLGTANVMEHLSGGYVSNDASARYVESNSMRIWFWRMAVSAVIEHPWLGVGAGQYVGFSSLQALKYSEVPGGGADSNAHNLILHLLAEFGIVFGALILVLLLVWVGRRMLEVFSGKMDVARSCALTGCLLLLAHSMVEFPFWFLYLLIPFGVLAGMADSGSERPMYLIGRFAWLVLSSIFSVCVLLAYGHYQHLQNAMSELSELVSFGQPPKLTDGIAQNLNKVPKWSPYRGYADAIGLIVAIPSADNAASLAAECRKVENYAPSPYLLARCAAAAIKAGDPSGGDYFAVRLCRLYPRSTIEMMRSFQLSGLKKNDLAPLSADCVKSVLRATNL